MSPRVRHFRQILVWPLQLMPIREGGEIQEPWELLERTTDPPWREVLDEFECAPEAFQPRHYSEFVTFLPYVRRFLYGEGRGRGGSPGADSPIRVFRRKDVARVRMTFPDAEAPLDVEIVHVDLHFFYDLDIAILAVEIASGAQTVLAAPDISDPSGLRTARGAGVFAVADSEGDAIFAAE